jgi:hypothetical protein
MKSFSQHETNKEKTYNICIVQVDDIEDEIYREKLKIKRCADELDETFDDMMVHY